MEVYFTPEQQVKLAQIASKTGTVPEGLVTSLVTRYLDAQSRFVSSVENGLLAAQKGEFVDEEEMDNRIEAMFKL